MSEHCSTALTPFDFILHWDKRLITSFSSSSSFLPLSSYSGSLLPNLRLFPLFGAFWNTCVGPVTHWGREGPSGEERKDENWERLSVATVQCCGLRWLMAYSKSCCFSTPLWKALVTSAFSLCAPFEGWLEDGPITEGFPPLKKWTEARAKPVHGEPVKIWRFWHEPTSTVWHFPC